MTTSQLDFFKITLATPDSSARISTDNVLTLVSPELIPSGLEMLERKAARLREIRDRGEPRAIGINPKFVGHEFSVPTCGIANTRPEDMTASSFGAWKDAIPEARRQEWLNTRQEACHG